jgi:recombination protein RecT
MTTLPPNQSAPLSPAEKWELIINDIEPEFTPLAEANDNLVKFVTESRYARDIILAADGLQRCPLDSIRKAIRNVAAVGLTLNPAMKLAYLLPRDGQCCLDISARGLIKIAVDSGAILGAKSVTVRALDAWEYNGPFALPSHKFDIKLSEEARGPIVACYSVIMLPSRVAMIEVLTGDDIAKIRNFALSKAKNPNNPSLPWNAWYEEMIKKSTGKRGLKSVPPTERLATAVALLDENEGAEHDITPAAPRLTAISYSAAQPEPGAAAQDARATLVKSLELIASKQGTDKYAAAWGRLSKDERRLVGVDEHQRLRGLASAADQAPAPHSRRT